MLSAGQGNGKSTARTREGIVVVGARRIVAQNSLSSYLQSDARENGGLIQAFATGEVFLTNCLR